MSNEKRKSLLIVIRHTPYGSSLSRSAIDTALAGAAFDYPVSIIFLGDGVLNLLPDQDGAAVGTRNSARVLSSLPLYDIEHVYAEAESVSRYGLDLSTAPVPTLPLDADGIKQLLVDSDHLLGF